MTLADRKDNTVTLQELEQLAQSLRATTISHLALSGKDWSVRMTTLPRSPFMPPPEEATIFTAVYSPAPGLAMLRHPMLAENFIAPGQPVKHGDVLALVKVGVVYFPVRSPVSGIFISFGIDHGDAVGFEREIAKIQCDNPVRPGL
jgi:biotin carboxyl carrier protein